MFIKFTLLLQIKYYTDNNKYIYIFFFSRLNVDLLVTQTPFSKTLPSGQSRASAKFVVLSCFS